MKKRLLSIILTLCMVMSITPLNAFAVTEYGIWIGDEQVTSDKTSVSYTHLTLPTIA